jgi:hypothetical protein
VKRSSDRARARARARVTCTCTYTILLLIAIAPARADEPASDDTDARVAYITGLLEAIRASDPAALANTRKYIQLVERNKCQAPEQSLRVGCLLEAAAQSCRQQSGAARDRCIRVSDVVVTNRLGETLFVPKTVRYQIMSKHKDYRTALAREISRRYAVLVAELAMSPHFPGPGADAAALARGIEGYCLDSAGTAGLSWQYCVAAAVWFIGTDGDPMKEAR